MDDSGWKIYRAGERADEESLGRWLAKAPPWREPSEEVEPIERFRDASKASVRRGETYTSSSLHSQAGEDPAPDEETQINIALMLRRPLIVTGSPGIGKSSLAYHLAWALGLGEPLRWEINSRTSLRDGLYTYDAVDHLRAIQERSSDPAAGDRQDPPPRMGDFITLGPLGTALLPTHKPRVLLVDELDKGSYDLPNDLLHVFEEGSYVVPELVRGAVDEHVLPFDARSTSDRVPIASGRVRTLHHPVVVITSNAEREFPPAFLRRCVSLRLDLPTGPHLEAIVRNQLGDRLPGLDVGVIASAQSRYSGQATDVILQALYLEQDLEVPSERVERGIKRT